MGSTQFKLREGLVAFAHGQSSPYRQYVYRAGDMVSTALANRGSWESKELGHIVGELARFAQA